MKKLLITLVIVTALGVSVSALPYISVRVAENFPTQTAPTVAFTGGIDVPLGVAYTKMSGYATYDVDFSASPITTTWSVGFALQYGSDATNVKLGVIGYSVGSWSTYLEFKFSLPFDPFVTTTNYTE